MKALLPLIAILGAFAAALYAFRAPAPERQHQPDPAPVTAPPAPPAVDPSPDFSRMTAAEATAWGHRRRAEMLAKRHPVQPGEFTLTQMEIVPGILPGDRNLIGILTNHGTRTAYTVWADLSGSSQCLHAYDPLNKVPPLAPGQHHLFNRPILPSADPATLTVTSIELTE